MINWKGSKARVLGMRLREKRELYKCRDAFKTLDDVVDWGAYVRNDQAKTRSPSHFVGIDSRKKDKATQTDDEQSVSSKVRKKESLEGSKADDKSVVREDIEKMAVADAGESKAGDETTSRKTAAIVVISDSESEKELNTQTDEALSVSSVVSEKDTVKMEVEVKSETWSAAEVTPGCSSAVDIDGGKAAQPGTEKKFRKNDFLNSKISLYTGDITCLEIDAIVNAANNDLHCGGGVDRAIHTAAGYALLRAECEDLGGCKTGDAKITGGYRLPAKYVIHTVGPQGEYPDDLRSCYKRSMELLKEHALESIAFPCISTGIYGYPNENAAHIALETIRNWLEGDEYGAKVKRVIFCLFLDTDIKIYNDLMPKYFPFE